ncbi:MAG: hypothetical protein ACYSTQ_01005 [Planctomycetota bacterium]|jgi:hypothetical protein
MSKVFKYIYIDHNELIELEKLPTKRDKEALDYVLGRSDYKILLSPWHLVEATRCTDNEKAVGLGKFMESLEPHWLRDRVNIQKDEVKAEFFKERYACDSQVESICMSFLQLVGDFHSPFLDETPSEWIRVWKEHSSSMEGIQQVKEGYPSVFNVNKLAEKEGKFTKDFKCAIARIYIRLRLPIHNPQGRAIERAEKDTFINGVNLKSLFKFPSIYVEFLFSEFKRKDSRRRGKENDVEDNQHLVTGLTFADVFVTRDGYLRDGARYVKRKADIPVAEIYDSLASFVEAE